MKKMKKIKIKKGYLRTMKKDRFFRSNPPPFTTLPTPSHLFSFPITIALAPSSYLGLRVLPAH